MNYTSEKILVCENSRILYFLVIISLIYFNYFIRTVKDNPRITSQYLNKFIQKKINGGTVIEKEKIYK